MSLTSRICLLLILCAAAILKVHQLLTAPHLESIFFDSRSLGIAFASFEFALGCWLFSQWQANAARCIAFGLFCLFLVLTTRKLFSGADSCDCFGIVSIPPMLTFGIDIIALWMLCQKLSVPRVGRAFSLKWATFAASFAAVSFTAFLLFKPVTLEQVGQVLDNGQTVIVKPESWLSKELPLTGLLRGNAIEKINKGDWVVVLYQEDCSKCQELLTAKPKTPTAFVEIPPLRRMPREDSENEVWLELSDEFEWFVKAPVQILLSDGVVRTVR